MIQKDELCCCCTEEQERGALCGGWRSAGKGTCLATKWVPWAFDKNQRKAWALVTNACVDSMVRRCLCLSLLQRSQDVPTTEYESRAAQTGSARLKARVISLGREGKGKNKLKLEGKLRHGNRRRIQEQRRHRLCSDFRHHFFTHDGKFVWFCWHFAFTG